jgi:hypothetical protein
MCGRRAVIEVALTCRRRVDVPSTCTGHQITRYFTLRSASRCLPRGLGQAQIGMGADMPAPQPAPARREQQRRYLKASAPTDSASGPSQRAQQRRCAQRNAPTGQVAQTLTGWNLKTQIVHQSWQSRTSYAATHRGSRYDTDELEFTRLRCHSVPRSVS